MLGDDGIAAAGDVGGESLFELEAAAVGDDVVGGSFCGEGKELAGGGDRVRVDGDVAGADVGVESGEDGGVALAAGGEFQGAAAEAGSGGGFDVLPDAVGEGSW